MAIKTHKTEIARVKTCKGVFFRAYASRYVRGNRIVEKIELRLLKRRSCSGCDSPDVVYYGQHYSTCDAGLLEHLFECVRDSDCNDGIDSGDMSELWTGAIYTPVYIEGERDPLTDEIGDGRFEFKEYKETK